MWDPFKARIELDSLCYWRILLLLGFGAGTLVAPAQATERSQAGSYYSVSRVKTATGVDLEKVVIHGPSKPPPGFDVQRQAVSLPRPARAASMNSLTVPGFNWVFGCSAVSGAMIAGYYDRTGYPAMYNGPTNGGVMPLDNSSWPVWSDGAENYPSCPLIASKDGVDGRVGKGSVDDYWVGYGSSANDPYLTGSWIQHTWESAIGDYMKTSQSAAPYGNADGSTTFYNYVNLALPLSAADMEGAGIAVEDGTYGRKLFYEARGYTVSACYSQKTDNTIEGGFSFAQFKAEIDAGRPVMLNLAGHSIVGVGYDDTASTVYVHDTWDYNTHAMTWGGSYSGMELLSVSIVNLVAPPVGPSLGSFTPTSGRVDAVVTLSGSGFTGATAVSFNGTAAATFSIDGDTQITATVPMGATSGRITVDTPGGSALSGIDYTVITYDLNGDGRIDLKDLARIARYFGTSRAGDPGEFKAQYDLNGDGSIDEQDASVLFSGLE